MDAVPLLLVLGVTLIAAMGLQELAVRLKLPTISLLLVLGVLVGPGVLGVLPDRSSEWFVEATDIALTMIGFLLGGEFDRQALRTRGARAVALSLGLTVGTAVLVATVLGLLGVPWPLALLLGGIAPATDPAATVAVLEELDEKDELGAILRSVVALDDVWGVLTFSLALTAVATLEQGGLDLDLLVHGLVEIGGALLLGAALGAVAAPLTARIRPGRPTLLEALGLVLTCAGLARVLDLSPLLASVTMGAVLANLASHHAHAFRDVEHVEWPFLVVFFVLAGATFDPAALAGAGLVTGAYIAARAGGRFFGIALGALPRGERGAETLGWMPLALMPQAGVALGLALSAGRLYPAWADTVLTVAVTSTLFFELAGPPLARFAITRARARHARAAPP